MSEKRTPLSEKASKEATDWLILLQETPDDAGLLSSFDDWFHASPENAAAWAATRRAGDLIAVTPPAHVERWRPFVTEWRSGGTGRGKARMWVGRRRGLWVGAMAIAACLALVFAPDSLLRLQADYATRIGETRTVRLEDGTAIDLAPGSAIAVAYGGTERRVRLLAGEAFFEVSPNPNRPFRVVTGTIESIVLGTAFNVRRGDEGASVAVQHGVVRVDHTTVSPPVSEKLEAGQSVRVTWAGKAVRGDGSPTQIAAWRRRQLIAQDQPMGDVVDQLRRYYRGAIILADRTLAGRPVTGVYNLADPVDALRGVAHAHGATVRRITPWILVVSTF